MSEVPPTAAGEVTRNAVSSFENAPERLREIMQALVRHLHAFAADV